jgi:Tfp pilus assembly protein PilN
MESKDEVRLPKWVETGALVIAVLSILGPQLRGMLPHAKRSSPLMAVAPWIGALLTLGAFLLQVTWNASKVNSALAEMSRGNAQQAARIEQIETSITAKENALEMRVNEQDRRLLFLCNERRRDNEEAGRVTNGAPC